MNRAIVAGAMLALAFGTACSSRTQDRVVVVPRPAARRAPVREVVVVEQTHVPRGHAYGWWKQHGYSAVTLYYDGTSYYSRQLEPTGYSAVIVYQRDGKYYLPADEDVQESRHGHHGNGNDND